MENNNVTNFFCVYCKNRKKFDKYVKTNRIRNKYIIENNLDKSKLNFK